MSSTLLTWLSGLSVAAASALLIVAYHWVRAYRRERHLQAFHPQRAHAEDAAARAIADCRVESFVFHSNAEGTRVDLTVFDPPGEASSLEQRLRSAFRHHHDSADLEIHFSAWPPERVEDGVHLEPSDRSEHS